MKLISTILLALTLTACRTSSEVYTRQEEINREAFDRLMIEQQNTSSYLDVILSKYKATIKKTERLYAPPADSTGYQAIISETEYDIKLKGDKKITSGKEDKLNTTLVNDKLSKDTLLMNTARNKESDSRILKPPNWFTAIFFILLIISVFFFFRKKFVHN